MKKIYYAISFAIVMIYCITGISQTTIWTEDFTYPNGTVQGSGSPPKWTINTIPAADKWEVRNNKIEAKNIGSEGIWTSENLDISSISEVTVSVELSQKGKMQAEDYIGVYYILDGEPETEFDFNGYLIGDFNTATASQTGLSGNSLVLVIRLFNNNKKESHFFDNIKVFKSMDGDFCSNAIPIGEVTDLPFSTLAASQSGKNPGCGGNQDPYDIWYAYTATSSGLGIFDLCGSEFDTRLAIWDDCGGNVLACNEKNGPVCEGDQSSIDMLVSAGVTYYVQVGGNNDQQGTGDLTIMVLPIPPDNDNCANATPINEVEDLPFSTLAASQSGENPGCGGNQDPYDIWYAYTATSSGLGIFDLCGSEFDTRLAIWDACGGNVLACNEKNGPACEGEQSSIDMPVMAGVTYYVQVGGDKENQGNGDLSIFVLPEPPSNDDCANATPINEVEDLPFSTLAASQSGENPGCGGNQDPYDIWYAYTPTTNGTAMFELCGSEFDTRLAIWDACGGNVLACNEKNGPACQGEQSSIEMMVTSGVTYYVQVGGDKEDQGNGDLTIYLLPFNTNDDCTNAIAISEVSDLLFTTIGATAGGDNPGCGGDDPVDIWFAYTASASGTASIDLCGSEFDTRLAIWDACGGIPLACNDDDGPICAGIQSSIIYPVSAGSTYYIQVGGYDAEIGNGDLTISIDAHATWTGNVSNDWSDANNWLDGNIPTMSTNVLIPTNPTGGNFPETNSGLGAECNDLAIQSGARVYVPSTNTLTVNGVLSNNGGMSGLVIKADNNGMGSLLHSTTGVNATTEQYLTSERWHLISPPISNGQIATYLDIYLKEYNEPTDSWTYLVEPITIPMNATQGYAAWASDVYTGTTTVSFLGLLNNGDYAVGPMSYTPASPNVGWNLLGNPYPSALQWNNSWTKTDVSDWACIHNDGNDECYNASSGTGWPNAGDMANGIIPPTQGFWVRANSSSASLVIPQSERLHSSQAFYKESKIVIDKNIRLRVDGNGDFDVVLFQFSPNASDEFDINFDLEKRWGYSTSPNIYSMVSDDEIYSVDARPDVNETRIMPIGLEVGANGLYTISANELTGFSSDDKILLEDLQESKFIELSEGKQYDFIAGTEDETHRFNLHIIKSTNGISDMTTPYANIYSYNNVIYIYAVPGYVKQAAIYDMIGREVYKQNYFSASLTPVQIYQNTGYYVVHLITDDKLISKKVFLK